VLPFGWLLRLIGSRLPPKWFLEIEEAEDEAIAGDVQPATTGAS
jgi:hypothetical protein